MPDTPPAAPPPSPLASAVETLVAELEREHGWLQELREDAGRAERTCQRLLASVEAALDTLPRAERQPFYLRVMRLRTETKPTGRPPRDPRRFALLELLAERRDGIVTNAEARAHLERLGHEAPTVFVGSMLSRFAGEKLVTRVAMGRYRVEGAHPKLQSIRWRTAMKAQHEAAKAEAATLMALRDERAPVGWVPTPRKRRPAMHGALGGGLHTPYAWWISCRRVQDWGR